MSEEITKYKRKAVRTMINTMRDAVHENAKDHGWHDEKRDFGTVCMLIVSEISEALEEHRNHKRTDEIYYDNEKPEGIPVELADAIIRILDYCGAENIDIGEALEIKHRYNIIRPYRHGNKAC